MSPELIMKKDLMANKIDVFSFGVCLFQLISGCPPYFCKANDEDALYKYILKGFNTMYWKILRDRFKIEFS